MYLKKIELHGFKSFADKVNIEFQPGITGIVGPNGCGKSNISDAVRWVLGEQSVKSLRGSNMADVIFAGSQDRRAQNLAEVTLIFDNSDRMLNYDYNEVEITRRLYRQGNEAEYLLNRQQCRLKDITDLLLDTGLGRDSLSIISQGNISNFADSRPEERRVIFEEAAGVSKYKKRKIEAIRKLERTTDNLNRIKDIVYELENSNSMEELTEIYDEISNNVLIKDIGIQKQGKIAIKKKKANNRLHKFNKEQFICFKLDNYDVFVGKNNVQNDYLTLKFANDNDLWFHTKDIHGSHVILRIPDKYPSQEIINKVASIAAKYSKAKLSSNVPVDYTLVKYVKKPNKAKPGMVIYTHEQTVNVQPEK